MERQRVILKAKAHDSSSLTIRAKVRYKNLQKSTIQYSSPSHHPEPTIPQSSNRPMHLACILFNSLTQPENFLAKFVSNLHSIPINPLCPVHFMQYSFITQQIAYFPLLRSRYTRQGNLTPQLEPTLTHASLKAKLGRWWRWATLVSVRRGTKAEHKSGAKPCEESW